MSSDLEFKVFFLSAVMMKYFSHRQRLHFFDPGEYGWARLFIVQVMLYLHPLVSKYACSARSGYFCLCC